ncbi:hypothetical protein ACWDBF_21665 [Streptomyces angustmyceticus]
MAYRPYPDADRALRQLHRHLEPVIGLGRLGPEIPDAAGCGGHSQQPAVRNPASLRRAYAQMCQSLLAEVERTMPEVLVVVNAAQKMRHPS